MTEGTVRSLAARGTPLFDEIARALERCFAAVRVQVTGRAGVGKSSVRAVLAAHHDVRSPDVEFTEAASVDVPRSPDPVLDGDVLVHVLAGGVHQVDVDIAAASGPGSGTGRASEIVPVLAKADTVDDLHGVVRRLSAELGTTVHPLMGTMAASVMNGAPSTFAPLRAAAASVTADMLLTPERFMEADLPLSPQDRVELVERIEIYGVSTVVEALRSNPTADDATLRVLLTERSGVGAVARAVRDAVAAVRLDRQGRILHRLTELAAMYPEARELERYLGSDEAVLAIMRSALRALGEPEEEEPTLRTAQLWRDRWHHAREPSHARAALAVARGYTRMHAR